MQALQPLFSAEEEPSTRDNAVGAVSRMILALGAHLPLEQVWRLSDLLHNVLTLQVIAPSCPSSMHFTLISSLLES